MTLTGHALPEIESPLSDQDFRFAWANCERQEEMMLPIVENGDALLDFDDGRWMHRLLPVYDVTGNLLHPKHYGSLKGALVKVSVIAMSRVDEVAREGGCYWQVEKMEVLRIGRAK